MQSHHGTDRCPLCPETHPKEHIHCLKLLSTPRKDVALSFSPQCHGSLLSVAN